MKQFAIILSLLLSATITAHAQSGSKGNSYRVTLLRAAPGNLALLLNQVKSYRRQKDNNVIIMRHSQGDHWDLMLLEPAGEIPTRMPRYDALADFQHSFLAKSAEGWKSLKASSDASGLYHIEMFHAIAGKRRELIRQRNMENNYLSQTQQVTNSIFRVTFGSDVDVFTIGFHATLESFAASPDQPAGVFEKAAATAGFKNRADISFYLRSLIGSHHDTLASSVP